MKDKRIGPDTIMNIVSGISVVLWVIIVTVIILFAIANPTNAGMSASRGGLKNSGQWVTSVIFGLLVIQVLLSVSGIIFNMMRLKRKSDHMRLTVVLSAIFGIMCIVVMMI